jgi:ketopantoate hydroxymethyltransferase
MLTTQDYLFASLTNGQDINMILVGDSLGLVFHIYDSPP